MFNIIKTLRTSLGFTINVGASFLLALLVTIGSILIVNSKMLPFVFVLAFNCIFYFDLKRNHQEDDPKKEIRTMIVANIVLSPMYLFFIFFFLVGGID